MNWNKYNESLVKRGEILLDFDVIDNWDNELEEMNKGKEGRKFVYPDSFIKLLGYMRAYFHLPYRQTEGIVRAHASNTLPSIPDYSRICRRINRLDIKIDANYSSLHDDNFVIAIDSTGVKVTNRGEWIRHKWKVKRGYLKIHSIALLNQMKTFVRKKEGRMEHAEGEKDDCIFAGALAWQGFKDIMPKEVEEIKKQMGPTTIGEFVDIVKNIHKIKVKDYIIGSDMYDEEISIVLRK